jgi:predicted kinase
MARLIMTRGLPGSGKSTWARELCDSEPGRWKLVDKDSLRKLLDNGRWSKHNEKFVLKIRDAIVSEALAESINVIVHDTGFEPIHEERLRGLAKGHQFEVKMFDVPVEECIKRDLRRADSVGEAVIRDMHRKYLAPTPVAPEWTPGLPTAIIVDLDGTYALIGDRSPYAADQCHLDTVNYVISDIIKAHVGAYGYEVILCSGRQSEFRAQTEMWLEDNGIHYSALFMRKEGDSRKDSIIKRELFEENIRGKWNIAFVLDDRDQVVSMWRNELGLTCLQVTEGNF